MFDATSHGAAPQCHPSSPYRGVILSPREIEALLIAASHGERGTRNVAMVLVLFATALAFQGLCVLRVRDLVAAYGSVLKEAPLLPGRGGRSRCIVWRSKRTVEAVGLYPARRPDHAFRAPHRGLDPDAPLFVSDAQSGHARIDEVWIPELFRGMSSAHASAPRRARSARMTVAHRLLLAGVGRRTVLRIAGIRERHLLHRVGRQVAAAVHTDALKSRPMKRSDLRVLCVAGVGRVLAPSASIALPVGVQVIAVAAVRLAGVLGWCSAARGDAGR